jgi:hypothetical protein
MRVFDALRRNPGIGGVLLNSIPHGDDREGLERRAWGAVYHPETWRRHVSAAGFTELTHYCRPDGLPRDQQPWFASIWRQ